MNFSSNLIQHLIQSTEQKMKFIFDLHKKHFNINLIKFSAKYWT